MTTTILDTSVWIGFLREGRAEAFLRGSLRRRSVLLSSVAAYELYLGATTVHDKRDLDRIRAAFIEAGLVATPIFEDWCEAAILLSRYSRSHGVLDPRLHLADVLIVLCASRIGARVMSWNVKDMRRWNRLLPPRRRIRIEEPDHRG